MDLRFTSRDLQQACNRQRAMIGRWGRAHAGVVAQRLQELDAVERLADLELLPYLRFVWTHDHRIVTVVDGDGVRIRLRPELDRPSQGSSEAWRDSTVVGVLNVVVSPT